jgi:hypothetical protein
VEDIAEQRAIENLRAEGLVPAPKVASGEESLSDERTDDYTTMVHVYDGHPVTTRQQKAHAETLAQSGRLAFFGVMQKLKAEQPSGAPSQPTAATWDGQGRCPTCRRFPGIADPDDPITPDLGHDRVMALLGEESKDQEWGERLVAEARARGEERPADLRGWVTAAR